MNFAATGVRVWFSPYGEEMASIAVPEVASWRILPSSTSLRSSKGFLFLEKIPYLKLSSKNLRHQPVRAMGTPKYKYKGTQMREKHLTEMIEKKVMEAKEVCKGADTSDECKVAWDQVEEVSQAKAHLLQKLEKQDPLEYFCQDNPDLDECRIYEE